MDFANKSRACGTNANFQYGPFLFLTDADILKRQIQIKKIRVQSYFFDRPLGFRLNIYFPLKNVSEWLEMTNDDQI